MTAQIHERLILDGDLLSLTCTPPIPKHPRIIHLDEKEVNTKECYSLAFTTACWRQYIGTWEIKEERLYLRDIEGIYQLTGDEPLLAEEYSGTLQVPMGSMLKYVHMGFHSVYERTRFIEIEKGQVVAQWEESHSSEKGNILEKHPSQKEGVFSMLFGLLFGMIGGLFYIGLLVRDDLEMWYDRWRN